MAGRVLPAGSACNPPYFCIAWLTQLTPFHLQFTEGFIAHYQEEL
jgi:hypothetical protein